MSSWASQRFARFSLRGLLWFGVFSVLLLSLLPVRSAVCNKGRASKPGGLVTPKLARAFRNGASDLAPLARAVGVRAILRSEGCPACHAFFHLRGLLVLVEVEPTLEQHPVVGS